MRNTSQRSSRRSNFAILALFTLVLLGVVSPSKTFSAENPQGLPDSGSNSTVSQQLCQCTATVKFIAGTQVGQVAGIRTIKPLTVSTEAECAAYRGRIIASLNTDSIGTFFDNLGPLDANQTAVVQCTLNNNPINRVIPDTPPPSLVSQGATALETAIMKLIGWVVWIIVRFLGEVLAWIIAVLIDVAKYNNFINNSAITTAWKILRDIVNMFFILILVVVAFATVIGAERYQWREMLPRLFIMAVLVNFSKMIAGLLIDGSQLIMLTFVAGWADIGSGNFTQALGIDALYKINFSDTTVQQQGIQPWQVISGLLLALVLSIISVLTIGVMLLMLIGRIIMLWMLVVLSPAAYFCSTFPQGEEYHKKWWSTFINYLIVGPALAFFIWFGFLVLQTGQSGDTMTSALTQNIGDTTRTDQAANNLLGALIQSNPDTKGMTVGGSAIGSKEHLLLYVIAIGLFLGGATMAGELGTVGGALMVSVAEGVPEKLKEFAHEGAGSVAGFTNEKLSEKLGWSLNPMDYWKAFEHQREETKETRMMEAQGNIKELFLKGPATVAMERIGRTYRGIQRQWSGEEEEYQRVTKEETDLTRAAESQKGVINAADQDLEALQEYQSARENIATINLDASLSADQKREAIKEIKDRLKDDPNLGLMLSRLTGSDMKELDALSIPEMYAKISTSQIDIQQRKEEAERTLKGKRGVDSAGTVVNEKEYNDYKITDENGREIAGSLEERLEQVKAQAAVARTKKAESKVDQNVIRGMFKDQAFRALTAKKQKEEFSSIRQSSEIINIMKDILAHPGSMNDLEERARFAAGMRQLAENYDENEIVSAFGHSSDFNGFVEFFKKDVIGKGNQAAEQDLIQIANDVSFIAEKNNHFDVARVADIGPGGKWHFNSEDAHATAAGTEILKGDRERIIRNANRLGFGGELDMDGKRVFKFSKLGMLLMSQVPDIFLKELGRERIPAHFMSKIREPQAWKQLTEAARQGNIRQDMLDAIQKSKPIISVGDRMAMLNARGLRGGFEPYYAHDE